MTALYARDVRGGRGQVIDLSLLESMFSVLGPEAGIFREDWQDQAAGGECVQHGLAAERLSLF